MSDLLSVPKHVQDNYDRLIRRIDQLVLEVRTKDKLLSEALEIMETYCYHESESSDRRAFLDRADIKHFKETK